MPELERWKTEQAAQWLEAVKRSANREEAANALMERAKSRVDGIQAAGFARGRSNPSDDAIANALSRLQEAVLAYSAEAVECLEFQREARDALNRLEDAREAECLTLYYLCGKRWSDVAKAMSYSMDTVMALRRSGLLHAYDVMPHRYRDPLPPAL